MGDAFGGSRESGGGFDEAMRGFVFFAALGVTVWVMAHYGDWAGQQGQSLAIHAIGEGAGSLGYLGGIGIGSGLVFNIAKAGALGLMAMIMAAAVRSIPALI